MLSLPVSGNAHLAVAPALAPLFHPDGVARSVRVLGSAAAPLVGKDQRANKAGVDVILISPTRDECRRTGFLASAVETAARELASDGLVYALIPVRWRRQVRRMLRMNGFVIEHAELHLPDAAASKYLVPLDSGAVDGFERVLSERRLRAAAVAAFGIPGTSWLAARFLPGVGLIARNPQSRPAFEWIFDGGPQSCRRTLVIRRTWREGGAGMVLHAWSGDQFENRRVVKISDEAAVAAEVRALETAGVTASAAGVATPRVLAVRRVGNRMALLESELCGRTAATILRSRPDRVPDLTARIAEWIEAWNLATARRTDVTRRHIVADALADLETVGPALRSRDEYSALMRTIDIAAGATLPAVMCHNDLTMWNVITTGATLGIVDWEKSRETGPAMADFLYAAVDAAAAVTRYADRLKAFQECFHVRGRFHAIVSRYETRIARSLGLTSEVAMICGRLCWLHHAANERRQETGGERPFLRILQAAISAEEMPTCRA